MKKFIAPVLLACACIGFASANAAETSSQQAADVAAIRQLGQDMGDAMVASDIDKLDQMFADDWASVGSAGKVFTKENVLGDVKSGKDKLESFDLGPIDVQVFNNVAVAHGGVTEKRSRDGRDASGSFVYMDLLEKRAGKWVVVRSAGSRVK